MTQVVSPQAYRLDTPPGIFNVFHVSLLRLAADDPFPSQEDDNMEPPALVIEGGEEEFKVEGVLDSKIDRRRRGQDARRYLIK